MPLTPNGKNAWEAWEDISNEPPKTFHGLGQTFGRMDKEASMLMGE